jgi:hypothetical protein
MMMRRKERSRSRKRENNNFREKEKTQTKRKGRILHWWRFPRPHAHTFTAFYMTCLTDVCFFLANR